MTDPKDKSVNMIADPFGMSLLDVSEAQESNDELDLDDPDTDADLDRIAAAMKVEAQESAAELETLAAQDQAELEQQIAEDIALEREEHDTFTAAADPIITPETTALDEDELQASIETLLFLSDKPINEKKLREWIGEGFSKAQFDGALDALIRRYESRSHGIEVARIAGGLQLRTKPGKAELARKLAVVQTQRLSRGAMETLAIVAYKQPVLKEDIDQVRGVDSTYFVRGLLERGLIHMAGRSELPGRPILYETTQRFLEIFGINALADMPPLGEIEQMVPASESDRDDEDPKLRQMRKLVSDMQNNAERLAFNPEEDAALLQQIRDNIKSIEITTPYIKKQNELEKAAQELPLPTEPAADLFETAPPQGPESDV